MSNTCNRIALAGAHGCRVLFCEECKVAEVEIGSLSLRLEIQAFNSLGEMMQEALERLAMMNTANREYELFSGAGKAH